MGNVLIRVIRGNGTWQNWLYKTFSTCLRLSYLTTTMLSNYVKKFHQSSIILESPIPLEQALEERLQGGSIESTVKRKVTIYRGQKGNVAPQIWSIFVNHGLLNHHPHSPRSYTGCRSFYANVCCILEICQRRTSYGRNLIVRDFGLLLSPAVIRLRVFPASILCS